MMRILQLSFLTILLYGSSLYCQESNQLNYEAKYTIKLMGVDNPATAKPAIDVLRKVFVTKRVDFDDATDKFSILVPATFYSNDKLEERIQLRGYELENQIVLMYYPQKEQDIK